MLKKTISISEQNVEHLFADWNTQQLAIRQRIKAENLQILQNWSLAQNIKTLLFAICIVLHFTLDPNAQTKAPIEIMTRASM